MKYFNKILSPEFFLVILLLLILSYSYTHIYTDNLFSSYSYSELFVNYQAGLIRRGLLGEVYWQYNKIIETDPKKFFGLIFFILYITQIYFLYYICKFYRSSKFLIIFIFFAPQLILFPIYDYKVFFLKDIFSKFTIFLHGFLIIKFKRDEYLYYFKLLVLPFLILSILIHEYQILFIFVHILLSINFLGNKKKIKKIFYLYSILLIPVLFTFLTLGNQTQFNELNEILKIFNAQIHPQLGGGFKNLIGGFYKWHFYYFSYSDFLNFFLCILLSIVVPVYIFENFRILKIININNNLKSSYLFFFIPALICFLALDHGRNISLIANHIFIFYMTLNFNKIKFNNLIKKIEKNINYIFLLAIFVFFYIFMWKIDQYAGFGLQGKETTIFKSSLFAEFVKLMHYSYYLIDFYIFDLPEIKL